MEHGRLAEHFEHTLYERAVRLHAGRADLGSVGIVVDRRRDGRLDAERTAHTGDSAHDLWAIDEHFFFGCLVIRDRFKRDVRNDAADFLTFRVLLALVLEAAGRSARFVL